MSSEVSKRYSQRGVSASKEDVHNAIKNIDKGKLDDAKEKARKAESIAHALQNCLNVKDGGEIAENLNYLYRHIRFAAKNLLEKD